MQALHLSMCLHHSGSVSPPELPRRLPSPCNKLQAWAKLFLPTKSLDTGLKQLTDIENYLGDVLKQFQINIANALKTSQNAWETFPAITRNGAYIAKQPSLNASTGNITNMLNTFIVSQALQANNIITIARNTNLHKVSRNPSAGGGKAPSTRQPNIPQQNAWHVNCQENFTTVPGICND